MHKDFMYVSIYTIEYYSAKKKKKKEGKLAVSYEMDKPRSYYAKWKKSEKDKYHMISLTCRI